MSIEIPKSFICPISFRLMKEPYIDIYGDTYDKNAIFRWLETKQESPLSRRPLNKADLRINRSLKETIEDLLSKKIIIDEDSDEIEGIWSMNEKCKEKTFKYYKQIDKLFINDLFKDLVIKNVNDWNPAIDTPSNINKEILSYKWYNIPNFRLKIYGEIAQYFNPYDDYQILKPIDNRIKQDVNNIIKNIIDNYDNVYDLLINTFDHIAELYGENENWKNNENNLLDNMKNRIYNI